MIQGEFGLPRLLKGCVALALVGMALVLTAAADSSAQQATAKPDRYKVTVKKVEFFPDHDPNDPNCRPNSCQRFWTVKEADQEIDIASVNPGQTAANYVSGVSIPAGTYTQTRATISCTIKLMGSVTFGGTTYYTTSAGGTTTTAASLAEGSYSIPASAGCSAGTFSDTKTVTFTVSVTIKFDVASAIRLDGAPLGATLSPNTVTITMTSP